MQQRCTFPSYCTKHFFYDRVKSIFSSSTIPNLLLALGQCFSICESQPLWQSRNLTQEDAHKMKNLGIFTTIKRQFYWEGWVCLIFKNLSNYDAIFRTLLIRSFSNWYLFLFSASVQSYKYEMANGTENFRASFTGSGYSCSLHSKYVDTVLIKFHFKFAISS